MPADDDDFEDDATLIDAPLNRRAQPRIAKEIKVEFRSLDEFVVAYTEDISRGGIFVKTDALLPVGSTIHLDLVLPDHASRFAVIARVAYLLPAEKAKATGRNPGMGLEFLESESGDLMRQLEAFITLNFGIDRAINRSLSASVLLVGANLSPWLQPIREGGHQASLAQTGMEALGLILTSQLDLVIAAAELPVIDGWQLLGMIRQRPSVSHIPFVLVTPPLTDSQRLHAYKIGVDDIVSPDVPAEEVNVRIVHVVGRARNSTATSATRSALRGSLEEIPLTSVLSFVELEQRSGTLLIVGRSALATLFIRNGQVIDVECDELPEQGLDLLLEILDWPQGRFELTTGEVNRPATIEERTGYVLMEHARRTDEGSR